MHPYLEGDLVSVEVWILVVSVCIGLARIRLKHALFSLVSVSRCTRLRSYCRRGIARLHFFHPVVGQVRLKLIDLGLDRLSCLALDEGGVSGAHPVAARCAPFLALLLVVHVVVLNLLALQVDLEHAWVESRSRHNWVVFVAEIVPLLPLVDEDAQVGRVLVKTEQQLVQVVP